MRFVIFGAGAIGSGIGGHLCRTGHETVLDGPKHIECIRERGLQLVTADTTYRLAVPAVSSAAEVQFANDDVLLLCVKSQDTDRALVEIRAALEQAVENDHRDLMRKVPGTTKQKNPVLPADV